MLNSVVLKGEPKSVEVEVERLIHEVDIPESAKPAKYATPNLEFQVYVVAGGDAVNSEQPLPKILEPAISQIKSMFPLRGYRLLETIQNRVGAGDRVSSDGHALGGLATGPLETQESIRCSSRPYRPHRRTTLLGCTSQVRGSWQKRAGKASQSARRWRPRFLLTPVNWSS